MPLLPHHVEKEMYTDQKRLRRWEIAEEQRKELLKVSDTV